MKEKRDGGLEIEWPKALVYADLDGYIELIYFVREHRCTNFSTVTCSGMSVVSPRLA